MTHAELVDIGRRWLCKSPQLPFFAKDTRGPCPVVVTELASSTSETPDVLGWHDGRSFVIECKMTRADFKSDWKKGFRSIPEKGMGNFRYYLMPWELVAERELPKNWGLLYVNTRGTVRVIRPAWWQACNQQAETNVLISTIRRLGITSGDHVSIRVYTIPTLNTATLTVEEQ